MAAVKLALIVALAENGIIGRDNSMPWHLPEDLRHFKRITLGKPVIMGRKTWESLPFPLPGRTNLVISGQPHFQAPGGEVHSSLAAALSRAQVVAQEQGQDEIMVIGGAQVYAQALPKADRLYLTRIALKPAGDAYFPHWTPAHWQCVDQDNHPATETTPGYAFEVYRRIVPE